MSVGGHGGGAEQGRDGRERSIEASQSLSLRKKQTTASLVALLDATGARPLIDRAIPMSDARDGFEAMAQGDIFGKVVFTR